MLISVSGIHNKEARTHIYLLEKKIEQEKQAFIDSAKFVERMNKERRERDMRIQKQREKLLKRMEKIHFQIETDMQVRRHREEEALKQRHLKKATPQMNHQPGQPFRINKNPHEGDFTNVVLFSNKRSLTTSHQSRN